MLVFHYSDVMGAMASQITGASIVYSTVCSGADHRKHQSSASLAFVKGIHRWPVNSLHKGPVMRKMFTFDDVIMSFPETNGLTVRCISYKIGIVGVTRKWKALYRLVWVYSKFSARFWCVSAKYWQIFSQFVLMDYPSNIKRCNNVTWTLTFCWNAVIRSLRDASFAKRQEQCNI